MLEALRFVKGAIAKHGSPIPALTHFHIAAGRVVGYNGHLALSSPIALDLTATPEAAPFIKAISTCQQEISLSLTDNGRLAVKSGAFKAFIRCTTEPFPDPQPEGAFLDNPGGFIEALRRLLPFVSEDAGRLWATGILLREFSAYATNNVVLIEHWLGHRFPVPANIPGPSVRELLRIGDEPLGFQACENSMTFFYEGGRWLKTQLYSLDWPDLEPILHRPSGRHPIPATFFKAVRDLAPFAEHDKLYLHDGGLATMPAGAGNDGASVALALPGARGCLNAKHLLLLEDLITALDLPDSEDPRPCMFFGPALRGAILGMRG